MILSRVINFIFFMSTLVLISTHGIRGINNLLRFERVNDVDNKICQDSEIVFIQSFLGYGDLGLGLCSARCIGSSNCTSIFYNAGTSSCVGCTGIYDGSSPLLNSAGTKYLFRRIKLYHEFCERGDECIERNQECFAGTCICSPGYSYNPSNSSCITECETYGTTFQHYPQRRINSQNKYFGRSMTVNECFQLCISDALCVSVDYRVDNANCHVQYVTPLTMATHIDVGERYDLYVRDCA